MQDITIFDKVNLDSESYSNIINKIIQEVHKNFCGEEETIISLLISINTRLVINSKCESRNIVLSEMSGAGKDALVKTLCAIILEPEKTYFHRSKLSPEIFTYWHVNDNKWTWDGKVIHIEDPTPELMNTQGFKTMASGEKSATVVKEQKAQELSSNGKPNFIITTFSGCVDIEGIRRYPFIHMDTSQELTRRVKEKIAHKYLGEIKMKEDNNLINYLRELKSYNVKIPYAKDLVDFFPNSLITRTYFSRFLDYISSSCVLHQADREVDKGGYLLATIDDYDVGRIAFLKTLSNDNSMVSLNREQEDLLKIISSSDKPLFASEIHSKIGRSRDWVYRNLEVLKRFGLIEQGLKWKEDANKEVTTYNYIPNMFSLKLPLTTGSLGYSGCLGNEGEGKKRYNILEYLVV